MMPKFDYIKYQPIHRMCDDSRRIMNGYIINKSIVKYWYYYTIVLYHKVPIVTVKMEIGEKAGLKDITIYMFSKIFWSEN